MMQIPPKYAAMSLSTFELRDHLQCTIKGKTYNVRDLRKGLAHYAINHKWAILSGKQTMIGKTHLAVGMLKLAQSKPFKRFGVLPCRFVTGCAYNRRELCRMPGYYYRQEPKSKCMFVDMRDLGYRLNAPGFRYDEIIKPLNDCEILLLDELGYEPTGAHGRVGALIDRCFTHDKMLIATTPLNRLEFIERYGAAIVRRIAEMGAFVELKDNRFKEK